jgi:hypothetical protein
MPCIAQHEIYNCMLRQYPQDRFQAFREGGNLFSTTIAVLASAVQKLARAAPIRDGTPLYRGLSGPAELPDPFSCPDAQGRRGFAEWGFLSTTQDRRQALQSPGARDAGKGQPMATVMVIESSAVDCGADVQELSQYPKVHARARRPSRSSYCARISGCPPPLARAF